MNSNMKIVLSTIAITGAAAAADADLLAAAKTQVEGARLQTHNFRELNKALDYSKATPAALQEIKAGTYSSLYQPTSDDDTVRFLESMKGHNDDVFVRTLSVHDNHKDCLDKLDADKDKVGTDVTAGITACQATATAGLGLITKCTDDAKALIAKADTQVKFEAAEKEYEKCDAPAMVFFTAAVAAAGAALF